MRAYLLEVMLIATVFVAALAVPLVQAGEDKVVQPVARVAAPAPELFAASATTDTSSLDEAALETELPGHCP